MARARRDHAHSAAKSAPAEAQRVTRVAEATRQGGEDRREAAEARREAGERRRESAETARITAEGGRVADERIRQDAITTVRSAAESLQITLVRMEALEELRRTLRAIANPVIPDRH
jgi:hypothetical protein